MAHEIVLLTKADCHFCQQAKEVLVRLEGEYHLSLRTVQLDSFEGRELAERAGAPFPPVVLLDGETFSFGRLSERKLRKRLSR